MPDGRLSPEELHDFVQTSTIGLHAVSADGTILWANDADHNLLGYTKEEYIGRNIAEFHADRENLASILACLTSGERLVNRKAVLRHKDGSLRHVLIDSSGYFHDGRFVHTRCFTRDVTALTQQTEMNDALIRAQSELGDGVVICDDARAYWVNDAYCRMVGYGMEEILAPTFRLADLLAPEHRAAAEERSRQRQAGEAVQHRYDAALVRKDGTRVHCDISVKTLAPDARAKRICIVRDVSAQREAERVLREQRDMYDALLRAESDLGQGVLLSAGGRVVYANETFARLVGRPLAALRAEGLHPLDVLAPGEPDASSGHPQAYRHYETTIQRSDGTVLRVEVASVAFDLRGEPHLLALCRDVTREREEETRLKERDAFLTDATLRLLETSLDPDATLQEVAQLATARLAESATVDLFEETDGIRRVAIAHKDPARRALVAEHLARFPPTVQVRRLVESVPRGHAHVVNDVAAERVAEYARSADELDLIARIGVRHALLVPLWGRSGILGAIGLARSGEAPFTNEDAFVAKSLATRAALAFENARLHAATRRLEREWRSLYERHQRILDTAPAQILVINEAGRILSVNRSVRSPDPKTALDANAYDMVVPQDRERVKGIIAESMRSGRHAEYETQAILGPEDVRWFHVRVGPVEIDGEKGAVLVSTDIEDRKRAERELATMRAQLIQGEKLSALGSLVSGVAHELRTPLTFLSTNAFLLRRQLDEAARLGHLTGDARDGAERFIGEIMAGVDRINQLVEDLRRYTKARHDARLVPRALDEVVGDPIELFRATNRRSHHLESHVTRTRAVHLNVGGVQQIVLNLLQNAADATPPGGVVRVATRDEGDAVVLEVADEGDGIPKEIQERMFEPLFTTKTEGTGLGLSIVKRIVDEHGATISCESQVGKGAIFRVRFPSPKDA